MTTLNPDAGLTVVINTFRVKPGKAEELLALLETATEETMGRTPGFVSANFHVNDDGSRVINYAQWRSKADFEAMTKDPKAHAHMAKAEALVESYEPVVCALRWSHDA
jgi:quinol monooxygenase YgiN